MKQNGVSDDALRLSLLPYSLTRHAIAWYDRLPKNSFTLFDDMMRKFLSKYFPPSMVTKLRNEITKFEQKPHESLFEAWELIGTPSMLQREETFNAKRHRRNVKEIRQEHDRITTPNGTLLEIEMIRLDNNLFATTTESPEVVRQLDI
ncbi:reverse transcriptase domain-containing protein [Tanacetum coccineum]|uniref:Reverse transcriptase domain-containing protein n=1 Tax=Tanacetum coccineum TaxID=301880 RepID=A0ABQ5EE66_9ASTR